MGFLGAGVLGLEIAGFDVILAEVALNVARNGGNGLLREV